MQESEEIHNDSTSDKEVLLSSSDPVVLAEEDEEM